MTEQTISQIDTDIEDEVIPEGGWSIKDSIAPLGTFAVLLLIWEGCTSYFAIPTWLLPAPSEIAKAFIRMARRIVASYAGYALGNACRICALDCAGDSARSSGRLFAVPPQERLSAPSWIAVRSESRDSAFAGPVDRLRSLAQDIGRLSGLLLSDRCGHGDRPDIRPTGSDGSDPLIVGQSTADVCQDPLSGGDASYLRWSEDRNHVRCNRRRDR